MPKWKDSCRYDTAPLFDYIGRDCIEEDPCGVAERLGISYSRWSQVRKMDDLSERLADQFAVALGTLPSLLWESWGDCSPKEGDEVGPEGDLDRAFERLMEDVEIEVEPTEAELAEIEAGLDEDDWADLADLRG